MSSAPSVRAALVAGLHALETRVATGRWGSAATASQLNAGAEALPASLGVGSFIPFWPDRLTGAIPPLLTPSGAPPVRPPPERVTPRQPTAARTNSRDPVPDAGTHTRNLGLSCQRLAHRRI
jgi:hypothetical protein